MIIQIIYLITTSDYFDSIQDNKVLTNFYQDFEISKDLDDNYIEMLILNYLENNESEEIFIPSTFILQNNDVNLTFKYPLDKEVGHFDNHTKQNLFKNTDFLAHFYTQLIHLSIFGNCPKQSHFNPNNYSVKLLFSNTEQNVRTIIKKYAFHSNGTLKNIFDSFKWVFSSTRNPI